MSNSFHSMHYGCTVYGDATLAVESGICDAISFEIQNSEGDHIGAAMLDRDQARLLIDQLRSLVNEPHPDNARSEQCADAAWYLVRFGSIMWNRASPAHIQGYLMGSTPSRIICDAESIQWDRRVIADGLQSALVGRLVHEPRNDGELYQAEWTR